MAEPYSEEEGYGLTDGVRRVIESKHETSPTANKVGRRLLATIDSLTERNKEAEAYAKEGWDWLDEALDALGAKTVFDIKEARARIAELEAALRETRDLLEVGQPDNALHALDAFLIRRRALSGEPS